MQVNNTRRNNIFLVAMRNGKPRKTDDGEEVVILPYNKKIDVYKFIPDNSSVNVTLPEFPTKSGISKINATDICKGAIKNSIICQICIKTIADFNVSAYVDQCVLDILVSLY